MQSSARLHTARFAGLTGDVGQGRDSYEKHQEHSCTSAGQHALLKKTLQHATHHDAVGSGIGVAAGVDIKPIQQHSNRGSVKVTEQGFTRVHNSTAATYGTGKLNQIRGPSACIS
jgi:hypothetical protein